MDKKILIVGGGIAGLSLAIALARRGCVSEIVESNPAWGVYGVGIILQSNALRALATLGLATRCVEQGYPYSMTRHCDANGVAFRDKQKPNLSGDGLPSSCGILRPVLHDILCSEALSLGVKVRLGVTVREMRQTSEGVDVTFTDGAEKSYELLVGADGVNSSIRRMAFGSDATPQFTGQSCWRFTAKRPPEINCAHMFHGEKTVAGLIPLTQETMYLLLLTAEPGNPWMDKAALHDLLAARLAGYGGIVGALANEIPVSSSIVYSPLEPLLMRPPWTRGRAVLVGDAAHATTPHIAQGSSMAFEDAVVLSDLLLTQPDIDLALAAYTSRRYQRCKLIIDSSVQIGAWQLQSWAGHPDPAADVIGLNSHVLEALREPI